MTDEIKPALTPEEWAEIEASTDSNGAASVDVIVEAIAGHFQKAAAIALHCQPFGFTHEDVRLIRHEAQGWNCPRSETCSNCPDCRALRARCDDLAARIAALLPPGNG